MMNGKQVAICIILALVILKDPQLVNQVIDGLLNLLNGRPNG